MLVLTRKQRQRIAIGDNITVTVLRVKGQAVRLGIEAPDGVRILRTELSDKPNSMEAAAHEQDHPPSAKSSTAEEDGAEVLPDVPSRPQLPAGPLRSRLPVRPKSLGLIRAT